MRQYTGKRHASVLFYAIAVVVLLGTISTYALYYAGQTQRVSFDDYAQIQMELYARSAAEFGVLWMQSGSDHNRSQSEQDLTVIFENNYVYSIFIHPVTGSHTIEESNGTVVMDINGSIKDMQEIAEDGSEGTVPYRYTKRIIVKP